jgi:DNA-directed RNA polymerase subunit RPC12/RpoP
MRPSRDSSEVPCRLTIRRRLRAELETGLRTCSDCGVKKPLSEFTQNKGTPWRHRRCKACRARRAWEQRNPGGQKPATKTCKDCGRTMPLEAFVRIRSTATGHYLRCRECRARRARERYQTDPVERERQKARVARNRARKRAARLKADHAASA